MKLELDLQDLESIATRVAEKLSPILCIPEREDVLYDVEGLSEYLRVSKQWVYEHIHDNTLPYYKMGKYPRFRKRDIDKWLNSHKKGSF